MKIRIFFHKGQEIIICDVLSISKRIAPSGNIFTDIKTYDRVYSYFCNFIRRIEIDYD